LLADWVYEKRTRIGDHAGSDKEEQHDFAEVEAEKNLWRERFLGA
jgi:hypothetical protein